MGALLLSLRAKGHLEELQSCVRAIESKSTKLCGFAEQFERQSSEAKELSKAALPAKGAGGPRRM